MESEKANENRRESDFGLEEPRTMRKARWEPREILIRLETIGQEIRDTMFTDDDRVTSEIIQAKAEGVDENQRKWISSRWNQWELRKETDRSPVPFSHDRMDKWEKKEGWFTAEID